MKFQRVSVLLALWKDNEAEEWLKCTNNKCGVWSHADCLEKSDNAYVCFVSNIVFLYELYNILFVYQFIYKSCCTVQAFDDW